MFLSEAKGMCIKMKIKFLMIFLLIAVTVFLLSMAITSCNFSARAESSLTGEDINEKEPGLKENGDENKIEDEKVMEEEMVESETLIVTPNYKDSRYKEIYLTGGCFWGIQAYIDSMPIEHYIVCCRVENPYIDSERGLVELFRYEIVDSRYDWGGVVWCKRW